MKLKKDDLLQSLTETFGEKYSKRELREIINAFLAQVKNVYLQNGRVTISPLGTFFNRPRKARVMKHPSSGETIQVKEGFTPAFKASATIKREVNA